MAVRDGDDEEPAGRRPLPPEDRVWRHPAEIAWEADRRRRRRRRRQAGATMATGAAALGLVWLAPSTSSPEPAEVAGISSTPLGTPERTPTTTARIAAVPTSTTVARTPTTTTTTTPPGPTTTVAGPTVGQGGSPSPTVASDIAVITVRSPVDDTLLGGAIVVRDGYLVSSSEALAGSDEVVAVWGGETRPGTVIGADEVTDVAVIALADARPQPTDADADADADAETVAAGDPVDLADPEGREIPRTVAEIQAVATTSDGTTLVGVVQLDADRGAAPPGGAARSADGSIVGMTTATGPDVPAAVVPIAAVREVAEEIIRTGQASHPWLGLTVRDPATDDELPGPVVTELVADGPAARGGVAIDDRVVAIDGEAVDGTAELVAMLRTYEPGDLVSVHVDRDGVSVDCDVVLDSHLSAAA